MFLSVYRSPGSPTILVHTLLRPALTVLAVLLLAMLVVGLLWSFLQTRARKRRARSAADRGRAAERDAPAALERRGYRVLGRHPEGRLDWELDGEVLTARVEADLLVSRDGRRYVVEVKTGRGTRPTRRETRRQLLEYALAYDVDGVLLLDADADRLYDVAFPRPVRRRISAALWFAGGVAVGVGAAVLLH